MALTPLQRTVVKTLLDGGLIRAHLRPNGARCWRLLDKEYRPVQNLKDITFDRLYNAGYIERTEKGVKTTSDVYYSKTGRVINLQNYKP